MSENLIFLHLPKNGGTTFHAILNRMYPKENTFTIVRAVPPHNNLPDFKNMEPNERKKIKLLKGHAPFGLHEYMDSNTKYITFLRKPEDRIVSLYYYVLGKPKNRLYNTIKNMSLYEFVSQVKSSDVNNCQVKWISGIDDTEEMMLEKALENIENHFSFVGLTEKFDLSLLLIKKKYNWPLPYYKVKNKTLGRPSIMEIDAKTKETINEFNASDNKLYQIIEERLIKEIKTNPSLHFDVLKLQFFNQMYSNKLTRKMAGSIKRNLFS